MKLVCSKPQLVDIINTVQRAIAPKTSLPILECIKIDANGDGNVVFTGNNIDICIEYRMYSYRGRYYRTCFKDVR